MDERIPDEWILFGATAKGASHERSATPNQDFFSFKTFTVNDQPAWVMAVADGHGSKCCFRSDRGAKFAVEAIMNLLPEAPRLAGMNQKAYSLNLQQRIAHDWDEKVDADMQGDPITRQEMSGLPSHEQAKFASRKRMAYGSTVIATLLTSEYMHAFQLGDGDLVLVKKDNTTLLPLATDEKQLGNDTDSLCSPRAWADFRSKLIPFHQEKPLLVLLATDGYKNSFRTDSGFLKVATDLVDFIRESGWEEIKNSLPTWLNEASQIGSGDDVTVGILVHRELFAPAKSHPLPPTEPAEPPPASNENLSDPDTGGGSDAG